MKKTKQEVLDYLTAQIGLNPLEQAGRIIEDRAVFLGLKKREIVLPDEVLQQKRETCRQQINNVRHGFWTRNAQTIRQQLDAIDARRFPELKVALDRLKIISAFRSEFDRLAKHPQKNDNLFLALKRIMMLDPKDAGKLKELYLRKSADSPELKQIQKMVGLLKNQFPNIYEIEPAWLNSVANLKGRYSTPESQIEGFEIGIPSWLIVIIVLVVLRILLRFAF